MEASWLQNRSKIDVVCEKPIFAKSYPGCSQGLFFEVPGVQVGSKNRSWGVLEASWRCLRASWRHLGASWRPLGAS